MKEKKVKLYKFSELSEDAQQKVIDRERDVIQQIAIDGWASEYEDSLNAFCDMVGIKCKNWECSPCSHSYSFTFKKNIFESWNFDGIDPRDCTGKYLARFMRDICFDIFKGKYFGKLIPHAKDAEHPNGTEHIKRHSKVLFDSYDCPFTGFCGDNSILHPIYKWFEHPDYHKSLYDLIDDCLESFFSDWEEDMYSCGKDEYVREDLLANETEESYYEDGTMCNGAWRMQDIA